MQKKEVIGNGGLFPFPTASLVIIIKVCDACH